MDTGEGKFEKFNSSEELRELHKKYPKHGGWFRVDEEVILKGSRFRIKSVKPTELRLKLLPAK